MQEKNASYWHVVMPDRELPVSIYEHTNQKSDIATGDWSLHWHEALEFQFILSGSIRFRCNGHTETLYPGDLFFAGWCIPHHAVDFSDGTHYYVFQAEPAWLLVENQDLALSRYRDILEVHAHSFQSFIRNDPQAQQICGQLIAISQRKPLGWELRIKGLLLELLGLLFDSYCDIKDFDKYMEQNDNTLRYTRIVMHYITSHYATPFTLDELAAEVGLTKSYICRLFHQHTGTTIMNYVNLLRCYQAIYMMESGTTITKAALSVGFSDYNYFSRLFKKVIGCRPSEYMSKILAEKENS